MKIEASPQANEGHDPHGAPQRDPTGLRHDRPAGPPSAPRIGARYQVINELARGGMGAVSRAVDRLTGRIVTVKQLTVRGGGTAAGGSEPRALLAREFRLLASLRHPNIIAVLDYGFDESREPFLVMDLEENARTITEAAADRPLAVQVDFLVQMLRALLYLHRVGILHRDLKPDNVLVVSDQVKLLDFGLSIDRAAADGAVDWAGTPAYMAPEVLRGEAPSERSDLYAVGVIAWEMLSGAYPFDRRDLRTLSDRPAPRGDVDPRVRPVLGRLLAPDPAARPHDAGEVITELGSALERSLAVETISTRESFIQAAPFVGRDEEFGILQAALDEVMAGRGSTWLVGGESGVGKSRLLDELRSAALVAGAVALRGQAISQGGGPYHVWHRVLANLCLRVDVATRTAEVLKAAIPDISILLGRDVADAPVLDPGATRTRFMFAVDELVRMQPAPVVVILEDLQWVGSASLELLSWLSEPTDRSGLLLVGSFRSEEAPDLPARVKGARALALARLPAADVAALGEAMIGPAVRSGALRAFLEQETEGIPFFIVEVVRALAEHTGGLDRIRDGELPERILSGGMQRVVRRRLAQVPAAALPPLRTAAVIGRALDPKLMRALHPDVDGEDWATVCAAAAVLELGEQRWRFAHDKLREQLLADLTEDARTALHRRVAEAIERVAPGDPAYVPALAHHWRAADEPAREVGYARQAGMIALGSGACREAIDHLLRARNLLAARDGERVPPPTLRQRLRLEPNGAVDPEGERFGAGLVESGLSEAYYRLGDLQRCRIHSARALAHFGRHMPVTRGGWTAAVAWQAVTRVLQTVLRVRARDRVHARRVAEEVARTQLRLTDTFFYSLELAPVLWSSLRVVNQCEPAGPSPELAQGYVIISLLARIARFGRLAAAWSRRALAIAEGTGNERNVAWVLSRVAFLQVSDCRWSEARGGAERAAAIAEGVGDLRLLEESLNLQANIALFTGRFETGLERYRDTYRLSHRSGDRQVERWSLLGQGVMLNRLGRDGEALGYYEQTLASIDPQETEAARNETLLALAGLALSRLNTDEPAGAYDAADRAMRHLRGTPMGYWLQSGIAAVAEVLATLVERDWTPDGDERAVSRRLGDAVATLRRFGRHFPLGLPHALLWRGLAAWGAGRHERAMALWGRTLTAAKRLGTPYEGARAHLEIGRHLSRNDPARRRHLERAAMLSEALGSIGLAERARRELAPAGEEP